ncbi:hypothetical protein CONPUDRAFT_145467 [Coniophora puteana RWD-64-598 SS2]|uniref:Uncharacterized protein n=1 Tax=Coniophora puteana (strain RWD-64-598) TaxID=741705 RepID=A0A5M3MGJ5_CONPW|nr:uncharacterized protein CONPUDRAFT_145467 [Coniophora puteana RWD-64-598 SS2]EIW78116.1 hypothetical protein CONPUDRAFT_145467 [Coniophora puteana RWD-64-598 SS2]
MPAFKPVTAQQRRRFGQVADPVGIVLGMSTCVTPAGVDCPSPSKDIGIVLYNGPFAVHGEPGSQLPDQIFTVTVPASMREGKAVIGLAQFALLGGGRPWVQTDSFTVNVEH